MKKSLYAIIALAAMAFTACDEFGPVFTGKYEAPEPVGGTGEGGSVVVDMERTHTIAQLAAMYEVGKPKTISKNIIISGKVSTSDKPGNLYKSFFIQDETGGMEIKVGKNGLYNDYLPGQTVYVCCEGLCLGMYGYKSGNYGGNGMVQIGYEDRTGEYETSYIENTLIIDEHIIKGEYGDPVTPVEIRESDLPSKNGSLSSCKYIGTLVTLKGLKYAGQSFTLLYLDSNKDKKNSSNRVFLADETWGITTWAMSESKMKEYLHSGRWDSANIGNANDYNHGTIGDKRVVDSNTGEVSYPEVEKAAYSVSQYFKMGSTEIQIRTSGFSKFADTEIDPAVLSGEKSINATGILSLYQGNIQFTLIDITGIQVTD